MELRLHRWIVAAATAGMAACGGGGGGGESGAAVATAAPRSSALADTPPPAGFDFKSFRTLSAVRSTDVVADASRFADASRTYVSLWYADAAGERRPLALLTLATLQALDGRGGLVLTLPRDVLNARFEVYDRQGAATALSGVLQ